VPDHLAVPFESELEVAGDGLVADDPDFASQPVAAAQHVAAPRQGTALRSRAVHFLPFPDFEYRVIQVLGC
jgi:hypothetical protein